MTDVKRTDLSVAKKSYEAYGWYVGHKNHAGDPMPTWEGLPPKIQEAWNVAARAAIDLNDELRSCGVGER